MAKKSLEEAIKQFKAFDFDPTVIEIAYANVNGDTEKILDEILRMQTESSGFQTKPGNAQDEEALLSKAIEQSISEAKGNKISLEPLNPQQRLRKSGVPVGLKNIGNTCYFNSLLQTYFQNAPFVKAILEYSIPNKYLNLSDTDIQTKAAEDCNFKRKLASCRLVQKLKELFTSMIASDRKYIDPTAVISSIVDDYGNDILVGDQKDIGEFNLVFLSRIEEGLEQTRKDSKMEVENEVEKLIDSPSKVHSYHSDEPSEISFLRRSSIRISGKSILAQQFIGKMENTFHNESENIHQTEEELFSMLFVNVKHKELYKACEELVISRIDDYRNEKGENIVVEKQSWISQAPKTLFFQIGRVVYDKQAQTLKKINDPFDFPREFYIDPFLLKNKAEALKVQSQVRFLRQRKEKCMETLQSLTRSRNGGSILDSLEGTRAFLADQFQHMDVEGPTQNSLRFPQLSRKINADHLRLLEEYISSVQNRIKQIQRQINAIEQEIEKTYQRIRSTPYLLYSVLVHQGSPDSGHYYTYIYDYENNKWRKYNDLNISEECDELVQKEARGHNDNVRSAYYLVYAKSEVLIPISTRPPIHNYRISSDEGDYLRDHYSSFLSEALKANIRADNYALHLEIEQYKMNGLATRVVDVYAKSFEMCNENYRKNKPEKKKNSPPLLINLALYAKNISEEEFKSTLIEHCIDEYGPKEFSPLFEDMLRKKLSNFNDFKRPKTFVGNKTFSLSFISSLQCAIAARRLYECLEQQSYESIFGLLKELYKMPSSDYFAWMSSLFTKTIIVMLLIEGERNNTSNALKKLKVATILLLQFTNPDEERVLFMNCAYWLSELALQFPAQCREQIEMLSSAINSHKLPGALQEMANSQSNANVFSEIVKSINVNDALWNLSHQDNTSIVRMIEAREKLKNRMESANGLYREMKKFNYPLQKEERKAFMKSSVPI